MVECCFCGFVLFSVCLLGFLGFVFCWLSGVDCCCGGCLLFGISGCAVLVVGLIVMLLLSWVYFDYCCFVCGMLV